MSNTKEKFMSLIDNAELWSCNKHRETNQMYGNQPYEYHLKSVVSHAYKFINLLEPKEFEIAVAACWAHDTIEDTRQTYNDVKHNLGYQVAEVVYNVTQEKGKNRSERESLKYYDGIRRCKISTFVKLCDRMANMSESYKTKSSMLKKYIDDLPYFLTMLDVYPSLYPMIEVLENYYNIEL